MPITPDLSWSLSIGAGHAILSDMVIREDAKSRGIDLPDCVHSKNACGHRGRSGSSEGGNARRDSRPAPAVNTRFTPGRSAGRGLDELANRAPAAQRAELRQNLQQAYDAWPQLARQLGVPANDIGSALAAYLVGSWMAYNNVSYPDEQFKLAAEQMRHLLAEMPNFSNAGNADKQMIHEQLVGLGMMVALTHEHLKQNPNPSAQREVRQVAAQNLRSFLQTDPSKVHFRDDGLMVIR